MTHLEMAQALDSMERDVTSWEADFIESVLKRLKAGRPLSPKQAESLEGMHRKYFADDESDLAAAGGEEETEDGESGE